MTRRSRRAIRPRLEILEGRAVLSALTPAQLVTAYGLNAVTFKSGTGTVKGDGAGQTIAIIGVAHDANLATEMATFDAKYNLPVASVAVINQAGTQSNTGWAEEEALDVEWAHAAAPGAKLLVVEARSSSTTDLLAAVNAAKAVAGVSVVSMSWGSSEYRGQTAYDGTFTTPAGHTGITYLASAGDSGAQAEWPASSMNVVAVGGTTLTLNPSGTRAAESAWSGSGGAYSAYELEPSYQRSVQATSRRAAVDVALDANPTTGVSVYSVAGGGWIQVGGTSLSAPVWAGLIAIADEGRHLAGKSTLDGATQTLGDLYAAPSGSFNDITTGSRAARGYDTVTGLGTPNATTLVAALVADPSVGAATGTATTTTPTTGTTTGGGGSTATTTTPTPTAPRYPTGGWWGYGGLFGFFAATPTGSGTATAPRNAGPAAGKSSPPYSVAVRPGQGWLVALPPTSTLGAGTHRAVDVVLDSWGRAGLA